MTSNSQRLSVAVFFSLKKIIKIMKEKETIAKIEYKSLDWTKKQLQIIECKIVPFLCARLIDLGSLF